MATGGGFLPPIVVTLLAETKQYSESITKAGAETEAFSAKTATSAQKGEAAWQSLGKYAVGAAVLIGVESVRMASQFQASMEKLHTQAGVPQGQIKALSNSVLDLAGKVGTSPDSLAEALFHVESTFQSTGKSGKEMMDILKIGAEGARIGNSNLVDTQNALDAAIVSGIPGAQNFNQAMGILNATVGVGDMTMQNLAEALSNGVMPVVKNYGLTLRDVGATLAVFGDNNIRGAQAGTALRMAVQALAVPIKGGEAALHKMGITTGELARDMQSGGILKAMVDLRTHMDAAGITGVRVGEELTTIFGKRAGTGVAVLMNSLDLLKGKFPELDKSANNFAEAWKATSGTFKQQMADWTANMEHAAITLGMVLIPKIEAMGRFVADNQEAFKALAEIIGGVLVYAAAKWAIAMFDAFGARAVTMVSNLVSGIQSVGSALTGVSGGLASFAAGVGIFAVVAAGIYLWKKAADDTAKAIESAKQASKGWADTFIAEARKANDEQDAVKAKAAELQAAIKAAFEAGNMKKVEDLTGQFKALGTAVQTTSEKTKRSAEDIKAGLEAMGLSAADVKSTMDSMSGSMDGTAEAAKGLASALDALTGKHVSATESAIAWEKSLDTARSTLAKTGATTDITSEKGRQATGVILGMIKSTEGQIKALSDEGASSAAVGLAYDDHVSKLKAVMRQAGFTEDQISALIKQYGLVPHDVTSKIRTEGFDQAIKDAQTFSSLMDSLDGRVAGTTLNNYTNNITRYSSSGVPGGTYVGGMASGGVIGAAMASGGMITAAAQGFETRGPVLVGEGNPSYSEFVIPTDPQYHARSAELWVQAGKRLGMYGGSGTTSGATGGSSVPVGGVTINLNGNIVLPNVTDGRSFWQSTQAEALRYQRNNGTTGLR